MQRILVILVLSIVLSIFLPKVSLLILVLRKFISFEVFVESSKNSKFLPSYDLRKSYKVTSQVVLKGLIVFFEEAEREKKHKIMIIVNFFIFSSPFYLFFKFFNNISNCFFFSFFTIQISNKNGKSFIY